ncbi:MAG: helix-turn-helix domain-containing protein [Bacteroides sp.]|nr:helix-turn-helix domain-containing protein [Bacteroides sp.]
MIDYYEYSIPELIKLLGSRFKDYRLRSQMTQKDVAEQAGITIVTIHKFENGLAGNMSLGTFLSLMKAIGQIDSLDELMPELPESAYLIKDNQKKVQRIRHKKP